MQSECRSYSVKLTGNLEVFVVTAEERKKERNK